MTTLVTFCMGGLIGLFFGLMVGELAKSSNRN